MRTSREITHRAIGVGLGVIAILAGLDERTSDRIGLAHWGWPVGIAVLGVLMVAYLALRVGSVRGADRAPDPQQRRQLLVGALLTAAGILEVVAAGGWVTAAEWRYVWPIVLFVIAISFISYPERGTQEAQLASSSFHSLVGLTVAIGGMLAGLEAVRPNLPFATLWAVALFIAGVELVLYREPPGTREAGPPADSHP